MATTIFNFGSYMKSYIGAVYSVPVWYTYVRLYKADKNPLLCSLFGKELNENK